MRGKALKSLKRRVGVGVGVKMYRWDRVMWTGTAQTPGQVRLRFVWISIVGIRLKVRSHGTELVSDG